MNAFSALYVSTRFPHRHRHVREAHAFWHLRLFSKISEIRGDKMWLINLLFYNCFLQTSHQGRFY